MHIQSLRDFFSLDASATHEIYTLSLHDALPIYDQDEEALPYLLKAMQLRPGDSAVAFQVSLVRMRRGELDETRRMLEDIVDRKSTRLNSSHTVTSYAVFCLKKKKHTDPHRRLSQ